MLRKLTLCSLVLLLWMGEAQAAELAISFSDDTAQLALNQQIGDYQEGRSLVGVRGLYDDDKDTELVSASFDVLGPIGGTGLEIGAGVGVYYVNSGPKNDEIGAAGVGAMVRFVPPQVPQLGFSGRIYYCPEILNILDGEGLWDAEVKASYEIAPRATAFASYTEIEAEIENYWNDRTLDKSLRVGISMSF